MNSNTTMNAGDSVHGSLAECFIKIEGNRYNFMQMTEFESKYEVNIVDVPILGRISQGHKPAGGTGTWSGTAHFNQSILRKVLLNYKRTGIFPYFEIEVTNEDPTSKVGRQTVIHKGCLFDGLVLAKFSAGEEILDEELSGTFEDFDLPKTFKILDGML